MAAREGADGEKMVGLGFADVLVCRVDRGSDVSD